MNASAVPPSANLPADFSDLAVLLVEDDEIMRLSLEDRLRLEGVPVRVACDIATAHRLLETVQIDMVVSDIRLPDGSGAELFYHISQHSPGIPVILMTAYGDVASAVELIKAGAADYLTKPFELKDFIDKVQRHLSRIQDRYLSTSFIDLSGEPCNQNAGVLGKSLAMRRIERLIARLASVDSSVLITGESGVGKEVVATLLHQNSRRANGPLIRVNCAALPQSLVESELFGHEKGAFTGAIQRHLGRFEQANNGTIFLDEIAEIPPEIQVKLLRVLQEQIVERVGGEKSIPLDVRIIAATQVDLDEAVKSGRFRPDLYWRLNVIHIHTPPLRDRREDILYLSRMFVERYAREMDVAVKALSSEAEVKLLSMQYPGNIRELRNILERAVALCEGPRIMARDLMPFDDELEQSSVHSTLKESVEIAEQQAILHSLGQCDWVIGHAAQDLGISRKSLWEKMKRYGIEKSST
ncbi:MAG: sigma-54 dependent transcriptional regulator [Motiliproteus sp.]